MDQLGLLRTARNELVSQAGLAASNWGGAGAAFAAHAKLISDLILDLSGPAGSGARAATAPLNMLVQAVKQGRTGEDGSESALREVFVDGLKRDALKELKRLSPIGGAFLAMANNSAKLIKTVDGWRRLRSEYDTQLAALDNALGATELAVRSARADQTGLEEAKQRVDAEIVKCRVYAR